MFSEEFHADFSPHVKHQVSNHLIQESPSCQTCKFGLKKESNQLSSLAKLLVTLHTCETTHKHTIEFTTKLQVCLARKSRISFFTFIQMK